MQFTVVALVCCLIGSVLAYPYPKEEPNRFQLDGGYNSDKSGRDFHVEGQVPVWTSENKRHEVDVAGHYGQHFGGPYGNSPPSYGGGVGYRFRF